VVCWVLWLGVSGGLRLFGVLFCWLRFCAVVIFFVFGVAFFCFLGVALVLVWFLCWGGVVFFCGCFFGLGFVCVWVFLGWFWLSGFVFVAFVFGSSLVFLVWLVCFWFWLVFFSVFLVFGRAFVLLPCQWLVCFRGPYVISVVSGGSLYCSWCALVCVLLVRCCDIALFGLVFASAVLFFGFCGGGISFLVVLVGCCSFWVLLGFVFLLGCFFCCFVAGFFVVLLSVAVVWFRFAVALFVFLLSSFCSGFSFFFFFVCFVCLFVGFWALLGVCCCLFGVRSCSCCLSGFFFLFSVLVLCVVFFLRVVFAVLFRLSLGVGSLFFCCLFGLVVFLVWVFGVP